MTILLDECLPRRLKRLFPGHDVQTVPEAGWAGIKNGRLLRLAAEHFQIFVTVDRNLAFQNRLPDIAIAVLVLRAHSNRYQDLAPLLKSFDQDLASLKPCEIWYLPQE